MTIRAVALIEGVSFNRRVVDRFTLPSRKLLVVVYDDALNSHRFVSIKDVPVPLAELPRLTYQAACAEYDLEEFSGTLATAWSRVKARPHHSVARAEIARGATREQVRKPDKSFLLERAPSKCGRKRNGERR